MRHRGKEGDGPIRKQWNGLARKGSGKALQGCTRIPSRDTGFTWLCCPKESGSLTWSQMGFTGSSPERSSQAGNLKWPPLLPQPNQIHLERQRAWPPFMPPIHLNYLDRAWSPAQISMKLSPASLLTLTRQSWTFLSFFFSLSGMYPRWLDLASRKQCKAEVLGLGEAGHKGWRLFFKPKFPTEQLSVIHVYNVQKHLLQAE